MILHTVDSVRPDHGGPSRTVPRLVRALCDAGYPAQLIVRDASGDGSLAGLVAALDAHRDQHTVVHDHGIWLPANHAIARWCQRNGVPRVVSLRGMLTPWAWQHRRWKKRIAWWLYQRRDLLSADAIHVTSDAERQDCLRRGIGGRIVCAANGVDLPASGELDASGELGASGGLGASSGLEASGELKASGELDSTAQLDAFGARGAASELKTSAAVDRPRRAVCLARLHPVKGLEMLIDAWRRAAAPGWQLTIAGPDTDGYADALRRRAAAEVGSRCAQAPPVEVVGPVADSNKWRMLASAELFLLASQSENFGMSIGEALACATPVIVTDRTPWREVQQLKCGWVVPYDQGELESAIAQATSCTRAELQQRGRIGRRLIEERYAWPRVASVLGALYSQLAPTCAAGPAAGPVDLKVADQNFVSH